MEEESRRDDDRISPLKNAFNNVAPHGEGQPSRFVVSKKDLVVLSRSETTLWGKQYSCEEQHDYNEKKLYIV